MQAIHATNKTHFCVLLFLLTAIFLHAAEPTPPTTNAPPAKPVPWDITIAAGLTLTKGNSDTLLGTVQAQGARKWKAVHELSLGADLTYGESSGIRNNETYRGFAQYNWLLTDRYYGSFRAEALHDGIADIEYRVILSPSIGYYLIKADSAFLRAELGPGFVLQRLGSEDKQYMTLRASERGEWKITKTAKLWEYIEVLPQVDDWENTIVNSELGIETAISTRFSLRAYIQDTFNNQPAVGRKKNDIKLVTGISYKL